MEWRLIESDAPAAGAENMALDHALFESVQTGGLPAVRFYRWDPPCLSLGRNQPAADRIDRARMERAGVDVVRRPTGGLAVWHDRELTYAVVVPVGVLGSPRETYVAVNRALVAGLRRLGVRAEVSGGGRGATSRTAASGALLGDAGGVCFREAAPGEVVAGGRKLIGSAQRTERRVVLQHGSLLLDGDQRIVAELIPGPAGPPPATLRDVLGRIPDWPELVSAMRAGFEEALGIRLAPAAPSPGERARIEALVEHYRSAAWTWRR
ncbi:MAG TPA: lipoate--protein ligase family protein [Longimicrobiales bacterium]|nr:lipoate--protein ligase family protein [Longimicrobiales bacterium]